jgi:hypothetical protein
VADPFRDPGQVLKDAFDPLTQRLRVDAQLSASSVTIDVAIDHANDSIRIGDGTNLATITQVGADYGLDVNIISGSVTGSFTQSGLSIGIKCQAITVTDSATKIPLASLAGRNSISIRVMGASKVYFDDLTVLSSKSYPKFQYEELIVDVKNTNAATEIWGICDTGLSSEIRIMELA